MSKTKMMSFDTSSTISGWAYWENGKLKESGIINFEKEKDTVIRVENMTITLVELLKKKRPDIVVIETAPLCNSPKTLIMLAEIIGVVKGWAINNYADFREFAVTEWRSLVAPAGEKIPIRRNDSKPWDVKRCIDLFGIIPVDDNEADAILIGLARVKEFEL